MDENWQEEESRPAYVSALESQLRSLEYQRAVFDKGTSGGIDNVEQQVKRLQLQEGQVLPEDHEAAMRIEDAMVTKIQHLLRVRFGRLFLALLKRRQISAAIKIQTAWRRCSTKRMTERCAMLRYSCDSL
jgi:hypothetical protein